MSGLLVADGTKIARIRKWVEALRSGKYEQGTGQLRTRDPWNGRSSFCCLGVACEVAGIEYDPTETHWPREAQVYYGLPASPEISVDTLVNCNDGDYRPWPMSPMPFAVIADYIESEWLS